MKKVMLLTFSVAMAIILGCAATPQSRPKLETLSKLKKGLSRIYISAGELGGNKLWSVNQVGPVFINEKETGSTAKDEHFVVDLDPGTYQFYCSQENPDKKLYMEKREFKLKAGEIRYFACDIKYERNIGSMFGLVGAMATKYLGRSYLQEKNGIDPNSKLVDYSKFK